jgi:protein-disulfide isomerase
LKIAALIALAVLASGAVGNAQPARPAATNAASRDWSSTVTRTAGGAFLLGNPAAKVRLVEYASLTCPHCAAFAAAGYAPLRADYIRRGLVSLELRHALRDRADLAASLLARCTGPTRYFATMEKLFATQTQWIEGAIAAGEAPDGASQADRQAALVATATAGGLPALAGLAPAAATSCLANRAEQAALGAMTEDAWGKRKIPGTPAFFINDKITEGTTWAEIQPKIAAALR